MYFVGYGVLDLTQTPNELITDTKLIVSTDRAECLAEFENKRLELVGQGAEISRDSFSNFVCVVGDYMHEIFISEEIM